MRLRDYSPSDRSACLAVFESNVPDYFDASEGPAFVNFLNAPGLYYVVESAAGEIVGCGGWYLDGDVAGLSWGIVNRAKHRRGFGKFLLAERLNAIRSDGRALRVRVRTIPAVQGFFERVGFRVAQAVIDGVAAGVPLVELSLDL